MGISNQAARVERRARELAKGWSAEKANWRGQTHVGGQALTAPEISALLKDLTDIHANVRTTKSLHRAAVRLRNSSLGKQSALCNNLESVLRSACGSDLKRLSRFGLKPIRRRGKLSVEKQVIAKAREGATRVVRGTKGKKQRAAIRTTPEPTLVIRGPDGKVLK